MTIIIIIIIIIPSRLAESYSFAIRYVRLRSKSSNTECVQTQYISDFLLRILWVSSAAPPFQGVVNLPVQVFKPSTACVTSWYSRWWRLSCGFLRGLEYLSRRCPLLWRLKHKPIFSYNHHRSLAVYSSRFHTMSVRVFLSSLNITWVSLGMFFLLSHFDLFEFDLGFSCSGFSILLEQPKAITSTWLSVSATHLSR